MLIRNGQESAEKCRKVLRAVALSPLPLYPSAVYVRRRGRSRRPVQAGPRNWCNSLAFAPLVCVARAHQEDRAPLKVPEPLVMKPTQKLAPAKFVGQPQPSRVL